MKCKASRCTGQRIQTASVPDTMLTTGITALFSLTCALAVANVYSAQPLLDSMAVSLKVSPGHDWQRHHRYAGGLCHWPAVLVPLGDWLNRKYVVMSQLLLLVAALVAAGLSPNIATLLGAMLIVGLMAVVVQVLVAWWQYWRRRRNKASGGYPDQRHCFRYPVISVYLRRDSRYRRLASRVSHGCLSDVGDCRGRLENHAFAPAAAAAAKADLPFLIEVRVSAVPHRAATESAGSGAIYLRRFQHAMDDHGHAAHRPFPLAHPDGDVWLSRLRWHAGRRQSGQVG